MVVNEGYKTILNLFSTETSSISQVKVAFSTSVVPPTLEDTAEQYLQGTVGVIDVDLTQVIVSNDHIKYPFVMSASFMNGNTISDAALIINNKLIARLILSTPIDKTSSVVVSGFYIIQATNADSTIVAISDTLAGL